MNYLDDVFNHLIEVVFHSSSLLQEAFLRPLSAKYLSEKNDSCFKRLLFFMMIECIIAQ